MNVSTLNLRRWLAHAVLGLLLLVGQHYATRHWLSHAIEATHAKTQGAPADINCDVCAGLAAFGAALPVSALALALLAPMGQIGLAARDLSAPATAVLTGYLSRAPPFSG